MPPIIPQEQKYCGNCGARLLPDKTCPNKCAAVTSINQSSPGDPTVPILPLKPAVLLSGFQHKKVYQMAVGMFILMILGASVLLALKNHQSNSQINTTQTSASTSAPQGSTSLTPAVRPIALVYKDDGGPAGCDGCAEAVAALLQSDTTYHFDVRYVGPNESLSVQTGLSLPGVVLYAQPGGNGTVETAYAEMNNDVPALQDFVRNGGRFLGFCLGGYLEGTGPGFNLLSDVGGDTDEYITSPGATVTTDVNTIIQVLWQGKPRSIFFQDGNYFTFQNGTNGATVLATYTNGEVAAVVAPYGKGKVGGVGPHPEADNTWYSAYNLTNPGSTADLGHDLIDATMR
jgi:glutamine amidotransferase-like uncharacterized protein